MAAGCTSAAGTDLLAARTAGGSQHANDGKRQTVGQEIRAEFVQQEQLAAAAAVDVELQVWRRQGFDCMSPMSPGSGTEPGTPSCSV